jgi:hypothetical protein
MATSRFWRSRRAVATGVGLGLLAIYGVWNVAWLCQGRIPPSLLTGLTGLPAPTTGGTRSMVTLANGDVLGSLYYNPLALPIVGLLALTLFQVGRRGRVAPWVGRGWIVVLMVAWVVKLLSPPATW